MAMLRLCRQRVVSNDWVVVQEMAEAKHSVDVACFAITRRHPDFYPSERIELFEMAFPSQDAAQAAALGIMGFAGDLLTSPNTKWKVIISG